jgi:predicted kinase
MLIVLGGLPGVGKTTVSRELARALGAVHVRIDSIEQAIRSSTLGNGPMDDAGYRVGYSVAEDNLRLGRVVVADCVNPWPVTRDAWAEVASSVGVRLLEIELVCSNLAEHRRRVEERTADVPGLELPSWEDVISRDYRPWSREHVVIDTSGRAPADCAAEIVSRLPTDGVKASR